MPCVVIISTGDELLYGRTIDTNSCFISSLFFGTNFSVIRHITVGDGIEEIVTAITQSLDKTDIIITTGGLGPTDDDNTVEAVCRVSGAKPVKDNDSNERLADFFQSMKFDPNNLDSKMSTVPDNSIVLHNSSGLAPGFIVEFSDKIIISLPGVPSEAENMMLNNVLPFLKKKYSFTDELKLTYRMSGIRESDINIIVNELRLPDHLKSGITSKSGICELIITGFPDDLTGKDSVNFSIKNKFSKYLLDYNAESPEHELVLLLQKSGLTLSTAESCTGGLISKRITDIPGSSNVYKGSVIAYSNEIKTEFLGVSEETLCRYGAVSENTAAEMAKAIKNIFKTDISISTTGIAGPEGGSADKPVGTVCFGFQINDNLHTFTRLIKGNRERIRIFSSLYAINFLRESLKKYND